MSWGKATELLKGLSPLDFKGTIYSFNAKNSFDEIYQKIYRNSLREQNL